MKKTFLMILAALLLPLTAHAGDIYFNGAGAEGVVSTTCTRAAKQSANSGEHTFVTMDCDDAGDDAFVWHFTYPSDAPTGSSIPFVAQLRVLGDGAAALGSATFEVSIRCAADSTTNYKDLDRPVDTGGCTGSATPWSCCTGLDAGNCSEQISTVIAGTNDTILHVTGASNAFQAASPGINRACALYVKRITSDSYTGPVSVVTGHLNY